MGGFANSKLFYIVAAGDEKASEGMVALKTILDKEGAKTGTLKWSGKLPQEEQEPEIRKLLAEVNSINFMVFTPGTQALFL